MFRSKLSHGTAVLLVLAALATPAASRAEITLTPFLGPYVAATRVVSQNTPSPAYVQVGPMTLMGFGLTWRHSPRLAAEFQLGYGRGELNLLGADAINVDAAVVNTDALIRWSLNDAAAPAKWDLIVGAGAYRLRGALTDYYRNNGASGVARARLAVIAGLGTTWRMGDGLAIRLEGLDHMHGPGLDLGQELNGIQSSRAIQHDVSMTLGVVLPLRK